VDADLLALRERLAEISDLYRTMGVLGWDQKVTMPPGGHPARAEALATIGRIAHERFTDDEIGRLLERLRPLEESLDYLASYWKEETEIEYEEMERRLDEVDPELFKEEDSWRMRLEEEYLQLHRWFRDHHVPIPDPGWRSQYVEDVLGLGYTTLLGD